MRPAPFAHVVAALLLLLAASAARAADWTYLDDDPARTDLAGSLAVADAQGVTLFGFSNQRTTLARYGNDGSSQRLRIVGDGRRFDGNAIYDLQPLGDGGYVALTLIHPSLDNFDESCMLERVSADLSLRWQQPTSPLSRPCAILGGNANGIWVRSGNHVQRYASDGVRTQDFAVYDDSSSTTPMAGALRSDDALLLATNTGPNGTPVISIHSPQGQAATLWTGTDAALTFNRLALDGDNNVYALGVDATHVHALSLTPAGTLRWEHDIDTGTPARLTATAAGADGRLYALDQRQFLIAFLNTGEQIFGHAFGPGCTTAQCTTALTIGAGGDAIGAFDGAPTQLMWANFQSGSVTSIGFPDWRLRGGVAALADGSVVVGALTPAAATNNAATRFAHIARSGTDLGDLPLGGRIDADVAANGIAHADDGTTYVLSSIVYDSTRDPYDSTRNVTLSAVSPQGQLRWKRALPAQPGYTALQAGSDRVCFKYGYPTNTLECRAASDGALLWSIPQLESIGPVALQPDGTIVALSNGFPGGTCTHYLFSAQGKVLHARDTGFEVHPIAYAFSANGTLVVSDLGNTHKVYAWDRDGSLLYAVAPPIDGPGNSEGFVIANGDGAAVVVAQLSEGGTAPAYTWSLSALGQTRWIQKQNCYFCWSPVKISASAVYLTRPLGNETLEILKYGLSDGAVLADNQLSGVPNVDNNFNSMGTDRVTGLLLATQRDTAHARRVVVIDVDQPRVLRELVLDCGDAACDPFSRFDTALSSDGTLRVTGSSFDAAQGLRFRIDAVANAASAARNVRVDQPGLDGAWFAPYESGQGFVFDYIESGKTVFMPWFTYGSSGANDPSGLAWYFLQGTVTEGANQVALGIGSTEAGTFNSGTVGAYAVGNAVLTFSDCHSGLLLYEFSFPGGYSRGGAIALARLTPSTSPCVLADGSSIPAQIANEPAQDFDARQSGSWFDPATSGQGLEFTIVPPGKGGNGLVFAAWFTFDPAGAADDVAQSHWFTLQGDLRNATGGVVQLPILRTIGGSLDAASTGNTVQVGHATLTFLACDRATLDYAFDASEVAHAFGALAGRENLVKLGGCAP